MDLTAVKYEVVGRIARITLNRPRYRNAQSLKLLEELDEAFMTAAGDPNVRVIVVSGEGAGFSSGHDLGTPENVEYKSTKPYNNPELGVHGRMVGGWQERLMFARWKDIPKPTIAMVHGFAIFNGWVLASTMDIVFAAEDALFLSQRGETIWDLPARKAKEIRFLNRPLTAQEAKEIGLVNGVFPADQLETEVKKFANEVADGDPHAAWIGKMTVNMMQDARGFPTFARASFGFYWAESALETEAQRDRRNGGRLRNPNVQRAFELAGRPEAAKKEPKQDQQEDTGSA